MIYLPWNRLVRRGVIMLGIKRFCLKHKFLFIMIVVLAFVALSGCTATTTLKTEDLLRGSFWERHVVYYFSLALDKFASYFGGEYGFAILLLTVIVRICILPLTVKQMKSSKEMKKLQPKFMEIKKKYKDNPKKQQEEIMKLYQQHNVNPLAGCLPIFIQMPIFIALYNAIYMNLEIREHTFLWLKLGQPDPYYILPTIAALTTYLQSKMMQSQMQASLQFMMLIFPILIFVMSLSFPAALPLYWVFSNIFTIIQNYFLYRDQDKEVHPAK